jgi:hypothetical protein
MLPALTEAQRQSTVKLSVLARSAKAGGSLFLFGVLWIAFTALSGSPRGAVEIAWGTAKWMIGGGLLWYIAAEIERNLEMRKVSAKIDHE